MIYCAPHHALLHRSIAFQEYCGGMSHYSEILNAAFSFGLKRLKPAAG